MPATPQRVWRAVQHGETAESSQDLPLGAPDMELEPGGRVGQGEIGLESAEEHIAGDVPERSPNAQDETGGAQ
jgi:hypothetical protein